MKVAIFNVLSFKFLILAYFTLCSVSPFALVNPVNFLLIYSLKDSCLTLSFVYSISAFYFSWKL